MKHLLTAAISVIFTLLVCWPFMKYLSFDERELILSYRKLNEPKLVYMVGAGKPFAGDRSVQLMNNTVLEIYKDSTRADKKTQELDKWIFGD